MAVQRIGLCVSLTRADVSRCLSAVALKACLSSHPSDPAGADWGSGGFSHPRAQAALQALPLPVGELRRSVGTGPLARQEGRLRPGGAYCSHRWVNSYTVLKNNLCNNELLFFLDWWHRCCGGHPRPPHWCPHTNWLVLLLFIHYNSKRCAYCSTCNARASFPPIIFFIPEGFYCCNTETMPGIHSWTSAIQVGFTQCFLPLPKKLLANLRIDNIRTY